MIDQANDNAGRMWHSLGFHRRDGTAEQNAQQFDNAVTVNAIKEELLAAERQGSGRRPRRIRNRSTILDVILRGLDARGVQPNEMPCGERTLYHSEVELVRWLRSVVGSGDLGLVSRVTPRWSQALDEWVSGKPSPATLGRLPAV